MNITRYDTETAASMEAMYIAGMKPKKVPQQVRKTLGARTLKQTRSIFEADKDAIEALIRDNGPMTVRGVSQKIGLEFSLTQTRVASLRKQGRLAFAGQTDGGGKSPSNLWQVPGEGV